MPDREKVIQSLRRCIYDPDPGQTKKEYISCSECAYQHGCTHDLMRDALALLREQEARVMKPEEIPDYDGAIYLEDFGEPEIAIAVYDRGVAGRVKFAIRGTRSTIAGYDDYNKRWRAWTSRPTPEQMWETKWEGDSDD